jgi:hypothetical protein
MLGDIGFNHIFDAVENEPWAPFLLLASRIASLEAGGEDLLGFRSGDVQGDPSIRPMVYLRSCEPAPPVR